MAKGKSKSKPATDDKIVDHLTKGFTAIDTIARATERMKSDVSTAQVALADHVTATFTTGPGKALAKQRDAVQWHVRVAWAKHRNATKKKDDAKTYEAKDCPASTASELWTYVQFADAGKYKAAKAVVMDYVKDNTATGGFRVNMLALARAHMADPIKAPVVETTLKRINGAADVEDKDRIVITGKGDDKKVVQYDSKREDLESAISRLESMSKLLANLNKNHGYTFDNAAIDVVRNAVTAALNKHNTAAAPSAQAQVVSDGQNSDETTAPIDFGPIFAGIDSPELLMTARTQALMSHPNHSASVIKAWKAGMAKLNTKSAKKKNNK